MSVFNSSSGSEQTSPENDTPPTIPPGSVASSLSRRIKPQYPPTWRNLYIPINYRLNSKLGTRTKYRNMVRECKSYGFDIITDAVLNHIFPVILGSGEPIRPEEYLANNRILDFSSLE